MTATIEFRTTQLHRVKPDPRNARTHPKQIDQIAASVAEHGFVNPVLINPDYILIAGHGRLRAARQLGQESVPTIVVTGLLEANSETFDQIKRCRAAERSKATTQPKQEKGRD